MTNKSIGNFLARRQSRQNSRELTQMLVLGIGISFIAMGVGLYKYFFTPNSFDSFWLGVSWFGLIALIVTLIFPFCWQVLEKILRKIGNVIGHILLTAILSIIYFLVIWPVGAIMRAKNGTDPIYTWLDKKPDNMKGWILKQLPNDIANISERSHSSGKHRTGLYSTVRFFVKSGNYFIIPVFLLLATIGIILFFLQTSVIAPFIYTLF